ncbi:Transmembrane protein [Quillaja saponaria]|uniref:Transmembrane protein n=1 Tax=Quillaja saponaria TaxID=32244 RepID=A0AAD7KXU1_QUISA|nr:Transmembrane protein [Quillaja saponaria]
MATTSLSASLPFTTTYSSIFNSRPSFSLGTHTSSVPVTQKSNQLWRIQAAPQDVVPSEVTVIEDSQQIVSTSDDGVSTIVSVLLFIAFVGLSILTVGVIYIAVTDFLQKREKEKFEKEEESKKSGKKKKKVRVRAGPRGFGQKIEEDEND